MAISDGTKAWVFETIYGRLHRFLAMQFPDPEGDCGVYKSVLAELHASWEDNQTSDATKFVVRRLLESWYGYHDTSDRSGDGERWRSVYDRVADELESAWTMPKIDRGRSGKRPDLKVVRFTR